MKQLRQTTFLLPNPYRIDMSGPIHSELILKEEDREEDYEEEEEEQQEEQEEDEDQEEEEEEEEEEDEEEEDENDEEEKDQVTKQTQGEEEEEDEQQTPVVDDSEEDQEEIKKKPTKKIISNAREITVGIRPRPVVYKPETVKIECKSEPIENKWHWAPGAWQDATRTSAFQPYKPPTLLTNLQRGNTQTEILQPYGGSDVTFHVLAGQGELTPEQIHQASIDSTDEKGLTGLMWAAGYGQLASARQLLKAGANKNYRSVNGSTPLHLASAYGHHDVVKLLLNHGAESNIGDEEGNTPLIYGAHGDHPHVCYELLSRGADITHRNANNVTAYQAAVMNNAKTAKAVIENYLLQHLVNISSDV